mgnify:CR=1 FL=1
MLNTGAKYLQIKKKSPTKHFLSATHVGRQQNALTTYMACYEGEASSLYDCVVQTNEYQLAYYATQPGNRQVGVHSFCVTLSQPSQQRISLPSPLGEGLGVRPVVVGGEADCYFYFTTFLPSTTYTPLPNTLISVPRYTPSRLYMRPEVVRCAGCAVGISVIEDVAGRLTNYQDRKSVV